MRGTLDLKLKFLKDVLLYIAMVEIEKKPTLANTDTFRNLIWSIHLYIIFFNQGQSSNSQDRLTSSLGQLTSGHAGSKLASGQAGSKLASGQAGSKFIPESIKLELEKVGLSDNTEENLFSYYQGIDYLIWYMRLYNIFFKLGFCKR